MRSVHLVSGFATGLFGREVWVRPATLAAYVFALSLTLFVVITIHRMRTLSEERDSFRG
jgi:hypothetical protein